MLATILIRAIAALPVVATLITLDSNPHPKGSNLQRLALADFYSFVIAGLCTLWEISGGWPS
jgi:hypothetical protein